MPINPATPVGLVIDWLMQTSQPTNSGTANRAIPAGLAILAEAAALAGAAEPAWSPRLSHVFEDYVGVRVYSVFRSVASYVGVRVLGWVGWLGWVGSGGRAKP